jgi:hypothetical protein
MNCNPRQAEYLYFISLLPVPRAYLTQMCPIYKLGIWVLFVYDWVIKL